MCVMSDRQLVHRGMLTAGTTRVCERQVYRRWLGDTATTRDWPAYQPRPTVHARRRLLRVWQEQVLTNIVQP